MDPFIIGSLITAGAGLFSAKSSEKAQQKANEQTANSAREQMEFQERMSSTAHQREVADLRASGLNPVLSANAGASSPGGAMSTFQSTESQTPERVLNSARALSEGLQTRENLKLTRATVLREAQSARLAGANARIAEASAVGAENDADVERSKYGKALAYIRKTLGAVGPGAGAFAGGFLGGSAKSIANSVVNSIPRKTKPRLDYDYNSYKG